MLLHDELCSSEGIVQGASSWFFRQKSLPLLFHGRKKVTLCKHTRCVIPDDPIIRINGSELSGGYKITAPSRKSAPFELAPPHKLPKLNERPGRSFDQIRYGRCEAMVVVL